MIKIHPLASLDADDLKCILAGYVSSAVYTVVKTETREHTAIALQLTPRSPPYVKHYDPIDDNTLARYGRVLSDGLSLGAHDGEVLVGVAAAVIITIWIALAGLAIMLVLRLVQK